MDPRRARDPRLARADPRLQRVQQDTPAPTPTPPLPQHAGIENGYAAQATPPHAAALYQGDAQSLQPITPASPPYKQRPLFCVVCASNQVHISHHSGYNDSDEDLESFHGGAPGSGVCHARLIFKKSI